MLKLVSVLAAVASAASPYDLVPPLMLDSELNYDFAGSTALTRNEVRLTMEHPGQRGYIVSKYNAKPLPEQFEMDVEFKVGGTGRNLYGDGMGFWFLEDTPPVMGNVMGLNEIYKGATLVVDTYRNGRGGRAFPRLLLMRNDGTMRYDADNDGRANEIDGCSMRGLHNNQRQEAAKLHISYSKTLKRLVVNMNYRDKWEPCINAQIDMGDVKYFAASAATGELSDIHTVRKITLTNTGQTPPIDVQNALNAGVQKEKSDREKVEERGSSAAGFFRFVLNTLWLLFKLALILGSVGGVVLYLIRRHKAKKDREYRLL